MASDRQARYIREEIQQKHANYIRAKKAFSPYTIKDDDVIKLGYAWYQMGHSVEDAEIELQKDANFVKGYSHARQQDIVNDKLFDLGVEFFEKGIPLVNIPTNYMDKPAFLKGYNKALKSSLNNKNKGTRR